MRCCPSNSRRTTPGARSCSPRWLTSSEDVAQTSRLPTGWRWYRESINPANLVAIPDVATLKLGQRHVTAVDVGEDRRHLHSAVLPVQSAHRSQHPAIMQAGMLVVEGRSVGRAIRVPRTIGCRPALTGHDDVGEPQRTLLSWAEFTAGKPERPKRCCRTHPCPYHCSSGRLTPASSGALADREASVRGRGPSPCVHALEIGERVLYAVATITLRAGEGR